MTSSHTKTKVPRSAGMLFPVFSMRRDGDIGIGDTTAVKQTIDWVKQSGVGFLQLLPINVSGSDNSPYSAISSVALDFIYLDMQQIPELTQDDIDTVRQEFSGEWLTAESVDYKMVRKVKSVLLRQAYERFQQDHLKEDKTSFQQFLNTEA